MTPVNPFALHDGIRPRDVLDSELESVCTERVAWHGNTNPYIPGLNALSDLFLLWHKSQQGDTSDLAYLETYLELALSSLDHLPPALRWRGGLSRPPKSNFGTDVSTLR